MTQRAWIGGIIAIAATLAFSPARAHPGHTGTHDELRDIRAQAEGLLVDGRLDAWNSWTHGDPSSAVDLLRRYPGLFSRAAIDRVRGALARTTDPRERQATVYLGRFLEGEFVRQKTAELRDSIASLELDAVVQVDTSRVPFIQCGSLIAGAPGHDLRMRVFAAQDTVLALAEPLRREVLEITRREAAALGYASRLDFFRATGVEGGEELEGEVRGFLQDTEALYDSALTAECGARLGMRREDFRRPDVARLHRMVEFDGYFPRQQLLPLARRSMEDLGIDLDRQRNILVDAEPRDLKNLRAACFPVRVPNDIRISVIPGDGFADYEDLFHELGDAERAACARQDHLEFRSMGGRAVSGCMAFLHQYLLEDPSWVRARLDMPDSTARRYLARSGFVRLMLVRRFAGRYLYGLALHRGQEEPREAYLREMRAALHYSMDHHDALHALADDGSLEEAAYLQGWFLSAMLQANLRSRFGADYFAKPAAGAWLKELWASGTELDAPALARKLGAPRPVRTALVEEMRRLVRLDQLGARPEAQR